MIPSHEQVCAHTRIDEGPLRRDADGSVFATCPDCGDDDFPVIDVDYEIWLLIDFVTFPPEGRTARQRRENRRRRIQRARRWAAWRRGDRASPEVAPRGGRPPRVKTWTQLYRVIPIGRPMVWPDGVISYRGSVFPTPRGPRGEERGVQ